MWAWPVELGDVLLCRHELRMEENTLGERGWATA